MRVSVQHPRVGDIDLHRIMRQREIVSAVENRGLKIKNMVSIDDLKDDLVLWGSEKREALAFKALFQH